MRQKWEKWKKLTDLKISIASVTDGISVTLETAIEIFVFECQSISVLRTVNTARLLPVISYEIISVWRSSEASVCK